MHKVGFKIKQRSPEILVGVGIVGTVASVVMACKATLKVNDIVEEAQETIEKIHEGVEQHKHTADGVEYTQELANRDLTIVYAKTGWKLVKLYGPAALVGVASVGCLVGSTIILKKRNIALAATVTALDTSFREYRGRLIERFGEDLDRELRFNIKAKEVEERVVDEDGNETVEKKIVHEIDPNAHSMYSVFFDDGNIGWSKNPELNKVFLIQQQEAANFRLRTEGFLPLNEVYKMIGAPLTYYGQVAGWVYSDDPDSGDNFVSFGLFDNENEKARDFINLREKTILLDFNCIGNILPYI
jgi:hypothetical protein